MRIESKVKYRIELKHDLGSLVLNAFTESGLLGDGITQVEDNIWESAYKCNKSFLDKCNARGSIKWSKFHVEKAPDPEEPKEEKPAKGKKGKKKEVKVEEVKVEEAPTEVVEEQEAPAEEKVEEATSAEQEAINSALDIIGE